MKHFSESDNPDFSRRQIKMDVSVSEPWFSLIKLGLKTVEGKKRSPKWKNLEKGDLIKITNPDGDGSECFYTEIINITIYHGFKDNLEEYLKDETLQRTLPGIVDFEEAKRVYLSEPVLWTSEEIEKYGIMAIELMLV
jgi:ASC-1-like (ASCH) protein